MAIGKVHGKEYVTDHGPLHRSPKTVRVDEVVFEADDQHPERTNVFARTGSETVLIGTIDESSLWIGSRELVATDRGDWVRPFISASLNETPSEAKQSFVAHWVGTEICVHPTLPLSAPEGDIFLLGGQAVSIQTWLDQAHVWMTLALTGNEDLHRRNVSFIMAGYAMELVFKSLAWALGSSRIQPVHKVRVFYANFDADTKRKIERWATEAGWNSAEDLLSYVDDFLDPVRRRYHGINPAKEFEGLNIDGIHKLGALSEVYRKMRETVDHLIRPSI